MNDKTTAALLTAAVLATLASDAAAQEPASSAEWDATEGDTQPDRGLRRPSMLAGIERGFGIRHSVVSPEVGDSESSTSFGLGIGAHPVSLFYVHPYDLPRFAFDGVTSIGVTVGAGAGFMITSGEGDDGVSTLVLAPRIGYQHWLSRSFAIWPRAGVTYYNIAPTDGGGDAIAGMSVTLDLPLVISPLEHLAFTLAPSADIGVYANDASRFTLSSFGANAGVLGWW